MVAATPAVPVVPTVPVVTPPPAVVPDPVVTPADPAPAVTLSGGVQVVQVNEDQTGTFTVTATVTGKSSKPIVPVLAYDQKVLALAKPVDASVAGQYTFTLVTLPGLAGGTTDGQVSVSLCEDEACARPYAGTTRVAAYRLTVKLADWGTLQRDAGHRGFVPLTLDPAKFTQLWSWSSADVKTVNAPVTGDGRVYLTTDNYNIPGGMLALDELTGALQWKLFATDLTIDPPAYANGAVYAHANKAQSGPTYDYVWSVSARDGSLVQRIALGRSDRMLAPAPNGASVYVEGASYAGGVTAFAGADGAIQWQTQDLNSSWSTPAVDQEQVYYYNGQRLYVYRRADGARVTAVGGITDSGLSVGLYAVTAPVLGSANNVLVMGGTASIGVGGTSTANTVPRRIANIALTVPNVGQTWTSTGAYLTQPALAAGVVYAGTDGIFSAPHFDAVSEKTGQVLWSWTPPATEKRFLGNVVATKNLVFVSTDDHLYALDVATHQMVWQAPYPGALAISANGTLVIATGGWLSNGGVVAFKLQ